MPHFVTGTVTEVVLERPGLQRIRVAAPVEGDRAYVLTELTGPVAVGDDVVLNVTAVELGLGTGGEHVVHWNLARDAVERPGGGHVVKLRYTSLQADTGAVGEAGDARELDGADLGGVPVVVGTVHSQLAGVAAAVRIERPDARVVYVMTDGGALPLVISDLVAGLQNAGLVDATVTTGHAFGGDVEAVGIASALTAARYRLGADVIVVVMGPGVVGTGTRLGTTALEAAGVLDAAAWLGGRPVCCLRVSDGDQRGRHRGISHHSRTVLDAVRSPVLVPVPPGLLDDEAPLPERHEVYGVTPPDVAALLAAHGLRVTTMGRGPDAEPRFFAACGAAGVLAATLVAPQRHPRL